MLCSPQMRFQPADMTKDPELARGVVKYQMLCYVARGDQSNLAYTLGVPCLKYSALRQRVLDFRLVRLRGVNQGKTALRESAQRLVLVL
jgi:hypothetical protein